ncbi:MAG: small basic protein [Candidatus Omnitrophica bacterium]|nr:small basic protein [Candidatus Omnitrophota bacterium]
MAIHPSLSSSDKTKKQRSVLKRIERLRLMIEKEQWKEGDEVCGLPKIKTVRIKIKKEKAEKVEATAEGATAAGAKEGAAAKETSPKSEQKK